MTHKKSTESYNWLGIILFAITNYTAALWPFVFNSVGLVSIFAACFVWAMAYERGFKLVWKLDGDKKMAILLFFAPSVLGLVSVAYTVVKLTGIKASNL